jgi:hypothetical protein
MYIAKGLNVSKAQGIINQTCHTSYFNLEKLYTQHKYPPTHIYNSNEIRVQVGSQYGAQVLARWGSHDVYNTIPKSQECKLIENCVVNVIGATLLAFYILRVQG